MYTEANLWREIRAIQSLTRTRADEGRARVLERIDAQLAAWVERADVAACDANGNTALLWVVLVAHAALPRLTARLIERGADPRACNDEHWSALHVAAARPSNGAAALEVLLDAGCDPNARQCDGQTPLHVAATMDALGCVERLLRAGSDPRLRDGSGRLALDLAAEPAVRAALRHATRRRAAALQRRH